MYVYPKEYDVIVVGAGHAGIEAALASARIGRDTLLLTMNPDTIGQMSCNPAIGGLAKGQLVRETDALGGEMGKATDMAGIQFRMLNRKKGPAVWSPRAQCDKKAYQLRQKWVCERQPNLDVRLGQTTKVLHSNGEAYGVLTSGDVQFNGRTIILTTGTFLRGLMHTGDRRESGGRSGEAAAGQLSSSLKEIGLQLGRLKTGTPPRLMRRSIDFSKTQAQWGDDPTPNFSFWEDELFHVEHNHDHNRPCDSDIGSPRVSPHSAIDVRGCQLPCFITYTTQATAAIIKKNIHRSPVYGGGIEGVGPRYCPSIEDKIVRFPDKDRHQIFLEPEGIWTEEIYVNGFSTCLPFGVQAEIVRTIVGCEKAEIVRAAYAVEYDFVFPMQLLPSLETKVCRGLYLAGQINGTSGYEEAAAQGIIAGINAARRVGGLDPITLGRDQAYIGVLIDDLITKGTTEPYRMFTSRAEYRLLLRQDNADLRLCDLGHEVGLLPQKNYDRFLEKRRAIENELDRLARTRHGGETLAQLLRRPEVSYVSLPNRDPALPADVARQVELAIKYEGYIKRQESELENVKELEDKEVPNSCDFNAVPSLRTEARQKLIKFRPKTLGQASRISGVSPADVSCLMVWLKKTAGANAPLPPLKEFESSVRTEFDCDE